MRIPKMVQRQRPDRFGSSRSNGNTDSTHQIYKIKISNGVYWVEIPRAGLYIVCGCPADTVKHLLRVGLIVSTEFNGTAFETGPNAILLSDKLMQNGQFSNLSEFPVLQMLYRQGLNLPDHPNNTSIKPLLIGSQQQVPSQKSYIYRGNYGLVSPEELIAAGLDQNHAHQLMRLKTKFAFGKIKHTDELIDERIVTDQSVELRNGVTIRRLDPNVFQFQYGPENVLIDLNLAKEENYDPAYALDFHHVHREYFAVIHSGEGDGWDVHRPCMASILMFQGKIYLIDAGPNIWTTLIALGIDPSEIEGIFHTHAHDDHFAGLPTLMATEPKIKYFATPVVRESVTKKLSALMSIPEEKFSEYFDIHDLAYDAWNNIEGLQVKPILSPHPIETNIFKFRAYWKGGYRSYFHLADIAGIDILEGMIAEDENLPGITREYFKQVKTAYSDSADLKKIDIGGGLIHGNALEFAQDQSKKIILAHKAGPLTKQEKAIGSDATFGAVDVLIKSDRDYLKIKAEKYLNAVFPSVTREDREILLNCPVVQFNPGSVIFKNNTHNDLVFLLLTGTVEYIDSEKDIQKTINTGSLVGDTDVLTEYDYAGTFRATSYIQVLQFNEDLYRFITRR